jgi:hypothetical protein
VRFVKKSSIDVVWLSFTTLRKIDVIEVLRIFVP